MSGATIDITPLKAAERFLAALHRAGDVYAIAAFEPDMFRWPKTAAEGARIALELDAKGKHEGVYHACGNIAKQPERGRGTKADVVTVRAAWVEMDVLDLPKYEPEVARLEAEEKARKTDKPRSRAKVRVWAALSRDERAAAKAGLLERARAFTARPSILVDSGRGIQAYWLLEEPVCVPPPAPGEQKTDAPKTAAPAKADKEKPPLHPALARLEDVNKRLIAALDGDTCADAARVLKVPSTHNRKDPQNVEPCTLLEIDEERRYTLEALEAAAPPVTGKKKKAPVPRTTKTMKVTERTSAKSAPLDPALYEGLPQPFIDYLGRSEKTRRAFAGQRTEEDGDTSGSAVEGSIIAGCIRSGLTLPQTIDVLERCPVTKGRDREETARSFENIAKDIESKRDKRHEVFLTTDEGKNIRLITEHLRSRPAGTSLFYEHGDRMSVVDQDARGNQRIRPLHQDEVGALLNGWFRFSSENAKGEVVTKKVPKETLGALYHTTTRGFRQLLGLSDTPIIRKDGVTVVTAHGYDETSRMLITDRAPDVGTIGEVTQEDARKASEKIADLFREYPFEEKAGDLARAALISGTLIARPRIIEAGGNLPIFVTRASRYRAGKGLLIDVSAIVAIGMPAPGGPAPTTDEEWDKQLGILHDDRHAIYHLDNAKNGGVFGAAALDAAVTSRAYSKRIIGGRKTTDGRPWDCVMVVSGNRIRLSADSAGRVVLIEIKPANARPADDRFERPCGALKRHAERERPMLLRAWLEILVGYAQHLARGGDRVRCAETMPGFEVWVEMVAEAWLWATGVDPLAGRAQKTEEADVEATKRITVFECLDEARRADPRQRNLEGAFTSEDVVGWANINPPAGRALLEALYDTLPELRRPGAVFGPILVGRGLAGLEGPAGGWILSVERRAGRTRTTRFILKPAGDLS